MSKIITAVISVILAGVLSGVGWTWQQTTTNTAKLSYVYDDLKVIKSLLYEIKGQVNGRKCSNRETSK